MKGFYTTQILTTEDCSEVDMDLYSELFGGNWGEVFGHLIEIGDFGGNEGISIDTIIEKLTNFKELGCSHVSIDYNVDHVGYELCGLKIRLSTEDEIKSYKKLEKEKEIITKQLEQLDKDKEKLVKDYRMIVETYNELNNKLKK